MPQATAFHSPPPDVGFVTEVGAADGVADGETVTNTVLVTTGTGVLPAGEPEVPLCAQPASRTVATTSTSARGRFTTVPPINQRPCRMARSGLGASRRGSPRSPH